MWELHFFSTTTILIIIMNNISTDCFWQSRYEQDRIEWDMGYVSPPIKYYIDSQLKHADKDICILIAGAGNGYEAQYLHELGFYNVVVVDFAQMPLDNFAKKVPTFNKAHLLQMDFFKLDEQKYQFDLAIEQAFFCAIDPTRRGEFVNKTHALLKPGGRMVGLLWDCDFEGEHPPFGGSRDEYRELFTKQFEFASLASCTNSHPKRQGRELFINFIAKS